MVQGLREIGHRIWTTNRSAWLGLAIPHQQITVNTFRAIANETEGNEESVADHALGRLRKGRQGA